MNTNKVEAVFRWFEGTDHQGLTDMLNDGWTVLAATALEYDGRGQMGVILQHPAPAPTSTNGNGATEALRRVAAAPARNPEQDWSGMATVITADSTNGTVTLKNWGLPYFLRRYTGKAVNFVVYPAEGEAQQEAASPPAPFNPLALEAQLAPDAEERGDAETDAAETVTIPTAIYMSAIRNLREALRRAESLRELEIENLIGAALIKLDPTFYIAPPF